MSAAELYIDLVEQGFRLRVDDDDRLIVSPGNQLGDADRTAIRLHKVELIAMVLGLSLPSTPQPRNGSSHRTPSRCLGPTACAVLGVCGRETCVLPDEFGEFASAMATARWPNNPHVVPDFYPITEEGDRAA